MIGRHVRTEIARIFKYVSNFRSDSVTPLALEIATAYDGGCSSAWLEHQIVDLGVAGSSPVSHPTF